MGDFLNGTVREANPHSVINILDKNLQVFKERRRSNARFGLAGALIFLFFFVRPDVFFFFLFLFVQFLPLF